MSFAVTVGSPTCLEGEGEASWFAICNLTARSHQILRTDPLKKSVFSSTSTYHIVRDIFPLGCSKIVGGLTRDCFKNGQTQSSRCRNILTFDSYGWWIEPQNCLKNSGKMAAKPPWLSFTSEYNPILMLIQPIDLFFLSRDFDMEW